MKIIQDDRTTSITASTPFSSTNYPISNVQDDKVSSRYIADTSGGTNSATITVNLTGTSSAPVEGFFVAGLMADSGTWSFQNANGSTVHESGTLTTTDIASSDIAGNTNTLNNYFDGQDNPLLSEFIAFSNPQTTTCRLVLTLSTSTNRKGQNIKGNAIASWDRASSTTGRFKDSGNAVINLRDFGRLLVGSQIVQGGEVINSPISTNTTITQDSVSLSTFEVNSGVTFSVTSGVTFTVRDQFPQVQSYTGAGTASGSVTISADLEAGAVSSILNPIRLGIFRCGYTLDLPNPQTGLQKGLNDYSIKRRLTNGGYSYEKRNIGKSITMSLILNNSQADSLDKFTRAYRSKPFSCLFMEDMATAQNETTRYSGFYYFSEPPNFDFSFGRADKMIATFNISEVL